MCEQMTSLVKRKKRFVGLSIEVTDTNGSIMTGGLDCSPRLTFILSLIFLLVGSCFINKSNALL